MDKIFYRYYCRMRPPAPGAIPNRNLVNAVATHVDIPGYNHFMWGYAEYTQPLTDEEVEEYELVPERVNE